MSKTQNSEYDYISAENYICKKLKDAIEIYKKQTKNHSALAKIYKAYVIYTPKCDADGNSFFPLISVRNVTSQTDHECSTFFYTPLHSMCIVFALFGNLVNALQDYQSIQVNSSS